jgi:hypothetical protein
MSQNAQVPASHGMAWTAGWPLPPWAGGAFSPAGTVAAPMPPCVIGMPPAGGVMGMPPAGGVMGMPPAGGVGCIWAWAAPVASRAAPAASRPIRFRAPRRSSVATVSVAGRTGVGVVVIMGAHRGPRVLTARGERAGRDTGWFRWGGRGEMACMRRRSCGGALAASGGERRSERRRRRLPAQRDAPRARPGRHPRPRRTEAPGLDFEPPDQVQGQRGRADGAEAAGAAVEVVGVGSPVAIGRWRLGAGSVAGCPRGRRGGVRVAVAGGAPLGVDLRTGLQAERCVGGVDRAGVDPAVVRGAARQRRRVPR